MITDVNVNAQVLFPTEFLDFHDCRATAQTNENLYFVTRN